MPFQALDIVCAQIESIHSAPQKLGPLKWGKENAGERHQINSSRADCGRIRIPVGWVSFL